MNARFSVETPPTPGAVGVIRIEADQAVPVLERIGCTPLEVGGARLRCVLGLDDALVVRPGEQTILVMPHGGAALMRSIAQGLERAGVLQTTGAPLKPDAMESRVARALAAAASPLAIDLLLDQPRRWRERRKEGGLADGASLRHLLTPPTVAAIGAPNIGKSSLLNALAGREAALAFDRPGTTRDAVGVLLDFGGLVIRWLDTPGLDTVSRETVLEATARADLVLRCRDAGGAAIDRIATTTRSIDVVTRADRSSDHGPGIRTSAATGEGLSEFASAVREALVPRAAIEDPRPWKFWEGQEQ